MSQKIKINRHCLRHFRDIQSLGMHPISLRVCNKSGDIVKVAFSIFGPNFDVKDSFRTGKRLDIDHEGLVQALTKKNGFFLDNFPYTSMIICLLFMSPDYNNYHILIKQLISMVQKILSKVTILHKQECDQIGLDPKHSSLKYLNLPSKKIMLLKTKENNTSLFGCKVCLRGVELIHCHLRHKYDCIMYLDTIDELSKIVSLSSLSQQWILNRKKLLLISRKLTDTDYNKYNFNNYTCYQTYDQLLCDMDITSQYKSVMCPFHASQKFSALDIFTQASGVSHTTTAAGVRFNYSIVNFIFCSYFRCILSLLLQL